MLTSPTVEKLNALRLKGMSRAFEIQTGNSEYQELGFEERLGFLVDTEVTERENKRLARLLKNAKLRHDACMQAINYKPSRKLDKSLIFSLETCQWIVNRKNVIIIGSTGAGKTFMAQALAHNACMKGYSSHCLRLPKFFSELTLAKADGSYLKLMKSFANFDVLILDDMCISPMTDEQRRDLLEIVEERYDRKSTIITSQIPIKLWHESIGNSTIADAILDRLVHNAYRIEIQGKESMRKSCQEGETLIEQQEEDI
jgi:DNA replication protein DnaC